jgi:hypothetical protein
MSMEQVAAAGETSPKPAPEIRFGFCREEEIPALMRFIGEFWRAGHVLSEDETLLRWQYGGSLRPLRDEEESGLDIMLAWEGDRIVGMMCAMGVELNVEGEPIPLLWAGTWLVRPDYRNSRVGLGVYRRLRQFGRPMAGLGTSATTTAIMRGLRHFIIDDVPRWTGVFDRWRTERIVRAGAREGNRALLALVEESAVSGAALPSSPEFEMEGWSETAAADWDAFWEEELASRIVGTRRNAAYLRWRYVEHPRFRYEIRLARQRSSGRVEGLLVYRSEQVRGLDERVLRIVEFLATPAAQLALAGELLRLAAAEQAAYADFYCTSPAAAQGLQEVGFGRHSGGAHAPALPSRLQPVEQGHFQMTAILDFPAELGSMEEAERSGRLYITKSDSDQDRPN